MTLSVFTGLVWGGYLLLRRLKLSVPATQAAATTTQTGATPDTASKVKEPIIVEFSRFLFPVVIIVFIVRGFVVEPFKIPSESMLPTLEIGDFILVNRFAYGLRLPVFDYKLLDLGSPKRGDVIVFRFPRDPSVDYIKRVVGLPGDRIRYENKHIFINDQQVNYTLLGTYIKQPKYEEYAEKLGDVNHHILLLENSYSSRPFLAEGHEITVPPNQYFAMGDNRDNSSDGRVWGFVPDANLKGRAFLVWFSWAWEAGESPKWSRIGNTIK
ncbi:MAG: signal peptidase I [Gammaproteobacteria bacterium]|nr:signal peptidase I [Gammaproteobacteria bacterium]